MIHSLKKWKTKEQLREILKSNADTVDITGRRFSDAASWTGVVSKIPYGDKILVVYKGESYAFFKKTDGGYTVL